ncbi:glycerol kinase GlpK [Nitrosomonas eutropha]|uniref:Glycerol kinase n=2 Tax=Nitrosomonas eutropha TaxID=916 RepID=GLPK_NITEC|nr:glycerol kinase GlpK [Nitrosomonas eutropha]Q0AEC9.1 RecName: Full=Glycerol kinase; AltName: Full=ATP:glycerol 3-phosphotransferase; AltName: Full=Glycerokinase; Short=GK [Nitrosomonas eutropha C91]ABI60303.1 glycerol kinase [Nitrosomonas eutropha C91]PXV83707.1 glycerol kinase [Nitrosomonas eutropha]SEI53286.1 glycerol kinase [Nitrosomonas eutropha]
MNNQPVILAIDQGTTSTRAILFSATLEILAVQQKELKLHYPHKGWVEQNPEAIWQDTLEVCHAVLEHNVSMVGSVAAIGITNQRETTILWDRKTGKPVYPAIVWQDRRTDIGCEQLKAQGYEPMVTARTGLLFDPYFSATKIAWILDNVEGVRSRAMRGELAFGTVDCYLLWHLTGGKVHATDVTNAARTLLFNIVEQKWDADLLTLFNIPETILPEVRDNAARFGMTDRILFGRGIPIGGMAGDQHAALIGQRCFRPGMVKSTYGTGCFALMNIGSDFKPSQHRLLTTPAYRLNGKMVYAIEGSIFIAGAAIQWLRDELEFFQEVAASDALALSVPDSNEVYFVPAFTGLGAPYWRPDVRGMISGLSRDTTRVHIVRAALEAQGYQTRDLMAAIEEDGGHHAEIIRVDGGLVANKFMCQFLADILNKPVEVPKITEATALGAAILAGLTVDLFADLEVTGCYWQRDKIYTPTITETERERLYAGWKAAVQSLLHASRN